MTIYVKSLSKTKEAEDKEKGLPIANLGATMIAHGEEFEHDSEFGSCLIGSTSFTFWAHPTDVATTLEVF